MSMNSLRSSAFVLALVFSLVCARTLSHAQPLTPGNLVVGIENMLMEYTPTGTKLQELEIPLGDPPTEHARAVAVLPNGMLAIYNGTFSPVLSIYDPHDQSWTHHAGPTGWSCIHNDSYGDVAGDSRYIYANDMKTFMKEECGLIRFDASAGYTPLRFGDSAAYLGLCIGYDGLIYGIAHNPWAIHVYDPITLQRQRELLHNAQETSIRGLCVNALGQLFTVDDWDGTIRRYDRDANLQKSLILAEDPTDIDLTADGRIIVGDRFGNVFLTTESLDSFSTFNAGTDDTYVTFIPIPPPVRVQSTTWGSVKGLYR
jgi:hypothetical protein